MSHRKKQTIASTKRTSSTLRPKVGRVYYDNPDELLYARFIQDMFKWMALENFRELRAVGLDWQWLQYFVYFTVELVSRYTYPESQQLEMAQIVEDGLSALNVAARNYNQSGYTFMYMTADERDAIRSVFLLCDTLKKFTDDKILVDIDKCVRNTISS